MMKDSESYREAYASQSRIFFRNPFSLNAHSGFFKGFNYFNLYYLCLLEYTYLPYQRDITAATSVQGLILMITAVFSAFH